MVDNEAKVVSGQGKWFELESKQVWEENHSSSQWFVATNFELLKTLSTSKHTWKRVAYKSLT